MKKVAGPIRINLAQYRELEAFAQFGSELDSASQAQLERGARVVEVLKQPQFHPLSVEEQVLSLYAVTNGFMDGTPVSEISRFEKELTGHMRRRHGHLLRSIAESGITPRHRNSQCGPQGVRRELPLRRLRDRLWPPPNCVSSGVEFPVFRPPKRSPGQWS